jgi:hypothetical protein
LGSTILLLALACRALAQSEHVPPDPPQTHVHDMTYDEMVEMMGMDDRAPFGKVMLDRLEWRDAEVATYEWEAAAWYGGDFNKVWLATEGEHVDGSAGDARVELLWDRILTAWWSTRVGAREDFGEGPTRDQQAAIAQLCGGDADCCAGNFCFTFPYGTWVCTPPLPTGSSCRANTQCQSGACIPAAPW